MPDHVSDLSNLLKIVSDPGAAQTLLDAAAEHDKAKAEAEATLASARDMMRQARDRGEVLDAAVRSFEAKAKAHAQVVRALEIDRAAHREKMDAFGKDRQELDARLAEVNARELALNDRATQAKTMFEQAEAMKARYERKMATLKSMIE